MTHASSWRPSRTLSAREALGFAEMRERSRIGLACEIVAQILAERYSVAQMPGSTHRATRSRRCNSRIWACRHGSARCFALRPSPTVKRWRQTEGGSLFDRRGEGKNVVPIDEAIAHDFMARGDCVSSSRQRVIIRCRMIFTAI